ncbi:MAG: acyl-homoserine-lactone synthase [Sedimenticola sp.]
MVIVSGTQDELPQGLYSDVSKYRYEVFIDRLGWELETQGRVEQDQFDRTDAVYVVMKDDEGNVSGCARLLPTTKPYLLGEVFPQLLNGLAPPRSPEVWELSRFTVMDVQGNKPSRYGMQPSSKARDLLNASIATAVSHCAKRLVTVSPIGIERLLHAMDVHAHRAGPPMVVDGHPLFACWIETEGVDKPEAYQSKYRLS